MKTSSDRTRADAPMRLTASAPRLHFELQGPRDAASARHTFVLAHALGCDLTMWDALAAYLARQGLVLRYDQRGHGGSQAPPGPYTMAELADDAARLIDEQAQGPVVWIGLSMGGMVGQELALRHPDRLRGLVLANTTSGYPAEARAGWTQRIAAIEQGGLQSIVDGAMQRWFHADFHARQSQAVAHWRERVLRCDAAAYVACCHAIAGVDTTARLPGIAVPTLVISGALDQGTPPAMARVIAQGIPGAHLAVLPEASHLSVLEQPQAFRDTLDHWLQQALPA